MVMSGQARPVKLRAVQMLSTIRRILMSLAVVGLVAGPSGRPSDGDAADQSAGTDHHAMMPAWRIMKWQAESMPCCPVKLRCRIAASIA